MEKSSKKAQEDLKKLLEGMRKKVGKLGKETSVWIKKGEIEISRLSKMGKLELNIVNLNMKKEKLFKDIGKRMVKLGLSNKISDSVIKNMCDETKAIIKESRKKRSEISRVGKVLFKGRKARKK